MLGYRHTQFTGGRLGRDGYAVVTDICELRRRTERPKIYADATGVALGVLAARFGLGGGGRRGSGSE